MTVETRTTFELPDVKAVEFECTACHAKVSFSIEGFKQPPIRCPGCDSAQWLIPGSEDYMDIVRLVRTMERFLKSNGKLFSLRFELKGEDVAPDRGLI